MLIEQPGAVLEWITPNPLEMIEAAGRVCYKSENRITPISAPEFVWGVIARGHEAVIEHAVASFRIICDRGISHEIVRHRIASYCQESTRYCNYAGERFGKEITVIMPSGLSPEEKALWEDGCLHCERIYFAMLGAGSPPQIARSVLPTCLKTELVMTANFREWRHFLTLRAAPAAHPQVREISKIIGSTLRNLVPVVFDDIELFPDMKG